VKRRVFIACIGGAAAWPLLDSKAEIDAAFTTLISKKADALDIAAHPFFDDDETIGPIAALSLQHKISGIFIERALPAASGLMSYGESCSEGFRHAGGLVARTPRARSPAIYRSMSPRRLNWSSMGKPPRHLAQPPRSHS